MFREIMKEVTRKMEHERVAAAAAGVVLAPELVLEGRADAQLAVALPVHREGRAVAACLP